MSAETDARVVPEVVMNDALAAAINAAVSTDDVRSLILAEAEKQLATKNQHDADQAAAAQAAADKAAADAAAAAAVAKANQVFTRTETIGGKEISFSASTEGELDRQFLAAYKAAYVTQTPVAREPEIDPAAAAKAAEAQVLAKAELERKFKLGEISAKEYIEQSGAVSDFLASQGISVSELKHTVEKNKADAAHQSWADASETFRTTVGADWPGGKKNRELLGDKLAALGLVDAEDKVAAMVQAWAAMKESGAYFPNGDDPAAPVTQAATVVVDPAVAAKAAADAAAAKVASDAAAARTAAAAKVRSMSSSLFGASSGTSTAPILNPVIAEAKKIIPDNASPEDILAAWKEEQVKNGQHPDDAFKSTFKAGRI